MYIPTTHDPTVAGGPEGIELMVIAASAELLRLSDAVRQALTRAGFTAWLEEG